MKKQLLFVFYFVFVSAIIFSQDTTPPTMLCKDITVTLDPDGNVSILASQIDDGSTDNIEIISLTIDNQDFECIHLGENTVTLIGVDAAGNSASCSAIVTVTDTTNPIVTCNNITLELNDMGIVIVNASDLILESSDNCSVNYSVSSESFDCTNIGDNTITLTATDISGNQSTCMATINVEDNFPPVPLCTSFTLELDETGNATLEANDIDGGSSDACEISSVSISKTSFECSDLGNNEITLTVTDNNGNSSDCLATVTVQDNTAPIAICKDITLSIDETGVAYISASDIDDGSYDDCSGINTLEIDTSEFDCGFIGVNSVELTVTDLNGNSSSCTANVTIEDNSTSTVFCNDLIIQLDETGTASITAEDIDGGSEGGCSDIDFLEIDISEFDCGSIGSNLIELTVTYTNGGTSSCTANVVVEDATSPIVACRDITVQLDETGNITILEEDIDNGSTDTCGIVSLSVSPNNFSCVDVGNNTVTLMATDINGNVSTCEANVLVENNSTPIAICQDITVQLNESGNANINAEEIDQGSTDPCGISSKNVTPTSFTCDDIGTNTVTLTVTNYNGESSSCDASVTIEDATVPNAICKNLVVQLDEMGYASITSHNIDNGSTDDCSGVESMELSMYDFDCHNIGPNTIELTVYDANGNTSFCNATVTIEDIFSPTALCQDIIVQLDETGNVTIDGSEIDNGSEDACEITSIIATPDHFDCTNVGENIITIEVTDGSGNSSFCNSIVTIEDNIPPIAICSNMIVQLDNMGIATITPDNINNGSEDECGISTLNITPNSFTSAHIGENTVTLTVTDNNGNQSTCNSIVTVEDSIAPIAICQDITIGLDETGTAMITADDINTGNRSTDIISLDVTTFDCTHIGNNVVTLTLTSSNGKSSTCTANVLVIDEILPKFDMTSFPKNKVIAIDFLEKHLLEDFISTITVIDNCISEWSISQSPNPGTVLDQGEQIISIAATDINNNIITHTFTLTIIRNPERNLIYPNPASDIVFIETSAKKIQLFNIKGRMVFESSSPIFNISTLANGIYFVQLDSKKDDILLRLIKE